MNENSNPILIALWRYPDGQLGLAQLDNRKATASANSHRFAQGDSRTLRNGRQRDSEQSFLQGVFERADVDVMTLGHYSQECLQMQVID